MWAAHLSMVSPEGDSTTSDLSAGFFISWKCPSLCDCWGSYNICFCKAKLQSFGQSSFRWLQLGGMNTSFTDLWWIWPVSQDRLKPSATRQKTNTLTSYAAYKSFYIPIKITRVFHYKNWKEMPYLCHYHKQLLISTFHVGNSDINYYNISRPALLSNLFFVSESLNTKWWSVWESCGF